MNNIPETSPADINEPSIPAELQELVNAELTDNETIQWIDQPIPYFFSETVSGRFLFAIFLTAFSAFWLCADAGVFDWNGGGFKLQNIGTECLFFAVLLLLGLALLSTPLWMRRYAKQTVYVITNHRAMIVQGTLFADNVVSYYLADLVHVVRTQKADGTGSIRFRIQPLRPPIRGFMDLRNEYAQEFIDIRNVKEVERVLQELKETK